MAVLKWVIQICNVKGVVQQTLDLDGANTISTVTSTLSNPLNAGWYCQMQMVWG